MKIIDIIEKRKYLLAFLLAILFYLVPLLKKDLQHVFVGDSLLKLLQTNSVVDNQYSSDYLFYKFQDSDPEYFFFPMKEFTFRQMGNRVSQYPALFAFLSAPFLQYLGESALTYMVLAFGFLCVGTVLYFFRLTFYSWLILLFGTPIIFYGYEFSENTVFLTLSFIAYSMTLQDSFDKKYLHQILVSFLLVLSMHFRLEAMVFIAVYFVVYFLLRLRKESWNPSEIIMNYFPLALSFLVFLGLYFFINHSFYAHPFGPRFIISGDNSFDIAIKLKQMFVLFFYGVGKVGFFGYMPIFFLVLFLYFKPAIRGKLSFPVEVAYFTLFIFVPFLSFISGSESIVNWGPRYLALAILPGILIVDHYTRDFSHFSSKKKLFLFFLLVFGFYVTWKGIKIQTNSFKMIQTIHDEIYKEKADLYIFDNEFIAGTSGAEFYKKDVLVAEDFSQFIESQSKIFEKYKDKNILFISYNFEEETLPKPNINNSLDRFLDWVTTRKLDLIRNKEYDKKSRREYMKNLGFREVKSYPLHTVFANMEN